MKEFFNETIYVPQKGKEDRVFTVEADVELSIEKNYGADIDGNRGVEKTFIDNIDIQSIVEILESGEEIKVEETALPVAIADYINDFIGENV
jgi:hypothetical protein